MPKTKIEQPRLSTKEQKSDFSLATLNNLKQYSNVCVVLKEKYVKQVLVRETKREMSLK